MKIYKHTVVLLGASLISANISAQSLSGLLTIDPLMIDDSDPANQVYLGGSYFSMAGFNPIGAKVLASGIDGGILLGTFQEFQPATIDNQDTDASPAIFGGDLIAEPFDFFNQPTFIGTNAVSVQSGNVKSAPAADVDMNDCVGSVCTLSLQLDAWEVYWGGTSFEQGPRPDNTVTTFELAMGTYDTATGAYAVNWTSKIRGGNFNNFLGSWHLEGTLKPVPVPAAAWLFGSGLVGLITLARKRSNSL